MKHFPDTKKLTVLFMTLLLALFSVTLSAQAAQYSIDDTGGDCEMFGTWDGATKTCSLTSDVTADGSVIVMLINGSDIVLEGSGHTIAASSVGEIIRLDNVSGCTIRNIFFEVTFLSGSAIRLLNSDTNTLENITFGPNAFTYAVSLENSDSNTIRNITGDHIAGPFYLTNSSYNVIEDNLFTNALLGVQVLSGSSGNTFTNNTFHQSPSSSDPLILLGGFSDNNEFYLNSFVTEFAVLDNYSAGSSVGNVFLNNQFNSSLPGMGDFSQSQFYDPLPVGGNYYRNYDTVEAGCADTNSDNICDSAYSDISNIYDAFPWVTPSFIVDADLDGFRASIDCNEEDGFINPGAYEITYNGIDENCNGMADDDDVDGDGYGIATDCVDYDPDINPGATEIQHDGIDQDCNGYDLTIEIISATYSAGPDKLTVEATSDYGQSASLELVGYGPMDWDKRKNMFVFSLRNAGGNPGTVTVTGPEGSESAPTN